MLEKQERNIRQSKKLLLSVNIKDFSEYIEISKARRATAYIKNKCRLPKKYDNSDYIFNKKDQLINKETGQLIIKNSKSAGKPRYKKINGQEIYNGNISRQARASLVKKIHEYFKPLLKDVEIPVDLSLYPLTLELLFYIKDMGKNNIDNDNKWIWRKCVQDTLTELGKWPDDNNYIINRNEEETILIPEDEEQELIINIYGQSR